MPCPCGSERLRNPRPVASIDGRVVRWAADCACGNVVVIDAKTGKDASEDGADVLRRGGFHDDNVPPPAA